LTDLQETAVLKSKIDRRRPDRCDTPSPNLIPLMRNIEKFDDIPNELIPNSNDEIGAVKGIVTAMLLVIPFWIMFIYLLM